MFEKTSDFQNDKPEFIKNPVIAEFWGLAQNTDYAETHFETVRPVDQEEIGCNSELLQ